MVRPYAKQWGHGRLALMGLLMAAPVYVGECPGWDMQHSKEFQPAFGDHLLMAHLLVSPAIIVIMGRPGNQTWSDKEQAMRWQSCMRIVSAGSHTQAEAVHCCWLPSLAGTFTYQRFLHRQQPLGTHLMHLLA
jgi:hypothetical protein